MITYSCDRCGEEVKDGNMKQIRYSVFNNLDLCPDCFEEFLVWLDMGKPLATQNSPNKCVD